MNFKHVFIQYIFLKSLTQNYRNGFMSNIDNIDDLENSNNVWNYLKLGIKL